MKSIHEQLSVAIMSNIHCYLVLPILPYYIFLQLWALHESDIFGKWSIHTCVLYLLHPWCKSEKYKFSRWFEWHSSALSSLSIMSRLLPLSSAHILAKKWLWKWKYEQYVINCANNLAWEGVNYSSLSHMT